MIFSWTDREENSLTKYTLIICKGDSINTPYLKNISSLLYAVIIHCYLFYCQEHYYFILLSNMTSVIWDYLASLY